MSACAEETADADARTCGQHGFAQCWRTWLAMMAVMLGGHCWAGDIAVSTVMIPMRDGVRLATDLYQPAASPADSHQRYPVVLTRSPYGKSRDSDVALARLLAAHGYIAAIQDIRGRYASEGAFHKYAASEPADGFDSIAYLAALPNSNGRVGMWGTSYGAHTQADAAKLNPPALKAMLINHGGMSNAWDHAVRHAGAFELGRELSWAFRQIPIESDDPIVKRYFEQVSLNDWYQAQPLRPGLSPLSMAPEYEAYYFDELTRSDYDDYWQNMALNWRDHYAQSADAAMLHVGGWYDIFLRGTIENHVGLSKLKHGPVQLLIGPWTHSGNARSFAGEVAFGADAAIVDFGLDFQRRWFDRYLKATPAESEQAPIRLFLMGAGDGRRTAEGRLMHGGYWTEAKQWPLPGATPTHYFLRAEGELSLKAPADDNSSTTFSFDPEHPVPTLGGNVSSRVGDGAYDQRERQDKPGSRPPYLPLSARSDVLVFQTEPLAHEVIVAGDIDVVLYVASSAVDTDFTAKLIDVYPPSEDFPAGFAMNLSDAIVRVSYRDDRTQRDLIEPGTVYRLSIRPFATANIFKAGHRIRLDISSSNFPRFDVNPNTGEPLGRNRRSIKADNTVFHDVQRASYLLLTTLPQRPTRAAAQR